MARYGANGTAEPHAATAWLPKAVYGLPEELGDDSATRNRLACPGCYPTAIQLGFLPLLEQSLVDPLSLIADAKSVSSVRSRGESCIVQRSCDFDGGVFLSLDRHLPENHRKAKQAAGHETSASYSSRILAPMKFRGIRQRYMHGFTTRTSICKMFFE